ncbi:hypothetical protein OAJ77_06460 [Rhodospirillales bacterium]|nr:hypothetical protein [Rhodospirillales bacterium]
MAHDQTHYKELDNGEEFDRLTSPSNPWFREINDYPNMSSGLTNFICNEWKIRQQKKGFQSK